MAEKLTPQQEQAVKNRGGKLLVSAAAGSGKTKVLVDRLLSYVMDEKDPANLDDFLIITYTKAAASELRGKIAAKLSERIAENPENRHLQQQMQRLYLAKISTVHSFCSDILREYAYSLDIAADFRVADENECGEIRSQVVAEILDAAYESIAEKGDFRAFVDTQGLGRTDALVPEILLKVYDSARCHLNPQKFLDSCVKNADISGLTDASQTVWGRYLIDDLHGYLDRQMEAVSACLELSRTVSGWEKVSALFSDTYFQLERLRDSSTWDDIVRLREIDYGRLVFPKKAREPELEEKLKAIRNNCKKGLTKKLSAFTDSSKQVLEDIAQSAPAIRGLVELVNQFSSAYMRKKRSCRIADFGDLEHMMLDLVLGKNRQSPTAIAREIGQRFREIMVDEYQDSNEVQDAIFSALTTQRQNLFMVGDVKQSIYQFRLADPGIFLEKYASFAPVESAAMGEGRKVLLSHNFRSAGAVISAVNHVFRSCMSDRVGGLFYGEEEALREGIPHCEIDEPEVELHTISVREDTYAEESGFVAERIEQLLDGTHMVRQGDVLRPIRPEDIVVLLRSPGSVGQQFQRALERRGIRCCSGGGMDLLKTQEIGILRSILQIISNPRQDIPLIAALMSPVFEFSADDLAAIRGRDRKLGIYEVLCRSEMDKSQYFLRVLNQLRMEARMSSLARLIERIFLLTGLDNVYAAMPAGEIKAANLQTFYQLCVDFEGSGRKDLDQFLAYLDSLDEKGLLVAGEQGSAGAVTIMSIHKSKGLEFPVVFLCGLSREFNRESLKAQVLCDKELGLGLSCVDRKKRIRYPTISKRAIAVKTVAQSLSEEMRVLYVAMTRARDRLIMTYAVKKPENDIMDLALRVGLSDRELLTSDVVCPGEWVLLAALQRTEAGELFALGGKPSETSAELPAWLIRVTAAPECSAGDSEAQVEQPDIPDGTLEHIRESIVFRYGHDAATAAPSKMTATQRKGRIKDQEAAENTRASKQIKRAWRKASFVESEKQGKEYGNAIHAVLQYIRYASCTDVEQVRKEISRLVAQQYITEDQGELASASKIAAFFQTELGKKVCQSKNVYREFKFSILDDASQYGEGLENEQVLLQGVVDCAIVEDDGVIIIDFKTDYVTDEILESLTEHYRPQISAYAYALERIFQKPVKEKCLYYFHIDRFVPV